MEIQIALPDEIANSLKNKWGDLERRLLEITLLEAYREGSISVGKLRELLGMSTRLEVDSWLKNKGVNLAYDEEDFAADCQTHNQLQ
ncbi:MAG: UPF0175 family protein [Snowella sp.]